MAEKFPAVVSYGVLKETNPEWDGDFWRRCHALYAGGKTLLGDDQVMKDLFPPHLTEDPQVYRERKRRAYYIPYAGEIVDAIVAALTSQPLTMSAEPEAKDAEFWEKFYQDVSRPGGKKFSFNQLLRTQILTALTKRTAWTLVDLPNTDPASFPNRAAQEASGALDPYACIIAPEAVLDWEEDDSGELAWVLVKATHKRRDGLAAKRNKTREEFTYYTREGWARYVVEYEDGHAPKDDAEVPLESSGAHSFGKVPAVRLCLPEGLYALGKIESIATAHLNKRNALSWAEYKSLFPVPVAYLGPPNAMNPVTEDEERATNQKHGPGFMRVMGHEDRMEYFGPDAGPFAVAAEDLDKLRDEMHRVLHHMALSVDNSGAALQRSADSKAIDQAAAAVVLKALGGYIREHATEVYALVSAARGMGVDADAGATWTAHGMDSFDDATSTQMVEEAVNLEGVRIPSATFQVRHKLALAKKLLGPDAQDEKLVKKIEAELEASITQEMFATLMDPVGQVAAEAEATLPVEQAKAEAAAQAKAANQPAGKPPGKKAAK